jgi:ATP adenylyltransferase
MKNIATLNKINASRFSDILAPNDCSREIYNEILFEIDGCVVTPTLGSIIPNWLLIIPRQPVLNFARWRTENGSEPMELIGKVAGAQSGRNAPAIWFEHGAGFHGSTLACGVEHAHLHVLIDPPFSFAEFCELVRRGHDLIWRRQPADSAYAQTSTGISYLITGSMREALVARDIVDVQSQFFRRIIAEMTGQRDAWDYKMHSFVENARITRDQFCAPAARQIG